MEEGKAKDGENTKRGRETRDESGEKPRKESILIPKKVDGTSVIHAITEAYFSGSENEKHEWTSVWTLEWLRVVEAGQGL